MVREGKIKRSCKVRLIRDGIVISPGELGSLKRFKDDAKEVLTGYDCGLSIQGYNDLKEGDVIKGNFHIISNQGEYTLPFSVMISHFVLDSSLGSIKNLFHFTNLLHPFS